MFLLVPSFYLSFDVVPISNLCSFYLLCFIFNEIAAVWGFEEIEEE
jgi:hypothetical protein